MSSDGPLLRLALYQPDIPQNTGTMHGYVHVLVSRLKLLSLPVFSTDRAFRQAGMDYLDDVSISRHDSWRKFEEWRASVGSETGADLNASAGCAYQFQFSAR